jgi:hypothetical protein
LNQVVYSIFVFSSGVSGEELRYGTWDQGEKVWIHFWRDSFGLMTWWTGFLEVYSLNLGVIEEHFFHIWRIHLKTLSICTFTSTLWIRTVLSHVGRAPNAQNIWVTSTDLGLHRHILPMTWITTLTTELQGFIVYIAIQLCDLQPWVTTQVVTTLWVFIATCVYPLRELVHSTLQTIKQVLIDVWHWLKVIAEILTSDSWSCKRERY